MTRVGQGDTVTKYRRLRRSSIVGTGNRPESPHRSGQPGQVKRLICAEGDRARQSDVKERDVQGLSGRFQST